MLSESSRLGTPLSFRQPRKTLSCVVDGKGDQGIDFISREDGVVLLVQAKSGAARNVQAAAGGLNRIERLLAVHRIRAWPICSCL